MMTTEPENTERQPLSEQERDQIKFLLRMLGTFVFFIIVAAVVVGLLVQVFG